MIAAAVLVAGLCTTSPGGVWADLPAGLGPPVPLVVSEVTHLPDGSAEITLTNPGAQPVVGWTVRVVLAPAGPGRGQSSRTRLLSEDRLRAFVLASIGRSLPPGISPAVSPGGTVAMRIPVPPDTVLREADVVATVFDDATVIGDLPQTQSLLSHRERIASAVDRWLPALRSVLESATPREHLDELSKVLVARSSQQGSMAADDELPHLVHDLAKRTGRSPDRLREEVSDTVTYLTALRAEALRHVRQ